MDRSPGRRRAGERGAAPALEADRRADEALERPGREETEADAERGERDERHRDADAATLAHAVEAGRPRPPEDRVEDLHERGEREHRTEQRGDQHQRLVRRHAPLVDQPLRREAVERRDARDRERGDEHAAEGHRHRAAETAQAIELHRAGLALHRPRAEEQAGLVERVVDHVEDAAHGTDQRAGAEAEQHVADLADGVEREQPPQVVLDQRHAAPRRGWSGCRATSRPGAGPASARTSRRSCAPPGRCRAPCRASRAGTP